MFEITPYKSVGPIRLGMSADELTAAIGEPVKVFRNRLGEMDYKYHGFRVALSPKDGTVVEIGLVPEIEVVLDGVNIFSSSDSFEKLVKKDGDPYEHLGFMIFLNLGITMTGFHDNDESQKAVTVFAKGRWDGVKSQFKKYAGARQAQTRGQ
jgi:hypothetical protein